MPNAGPIHQKLTEKMDHALEHLKRDLAGLRTGRASVALLDGVRVDYYGTMTLSNRFRTFPRRKRGSLPSNRGNRTSSRKSKKPSQTRDSASILE